MENRFNLVDEAWIPVADTGRVSLRQLFSHPEYRALGGNPIQKLALMKLLLAIAQAAATPNDENEWRALGPQGMAEACLRYLEQWHDRFWLYGERPFLQMPATLDLIRDQFGNKSSSSKSGCGNNEFAVYRPAKDIGAGFYPDLPSSNNTMLSQTMMSRQLSDAEKALFVVMLMNFSFGGKRVESDLVNLSGEKLGSRYSAPAGPSLGGFIGYLHAFMMLDSIVDSLWINLITHQDINELNRWPHGLGFPPWEKMPNSESDEIAIKHKQSYQSCLVALSRFIYFFDEGIYYFDGINYPGIKDGWYEPSLILDYSSKVVKVKYVDPEKKPWRELQSILSFIASDNSGFDCFNIKKGIERLRGFREKYFIWCAGLKVSGNSGDQSVKQSDDFVESNVYIYDDVIGDVWFSFLKNEMNSLESLSSKLWKSVFSYYKDLSADKGKKKESTLAGKIAKVSINHFWQLCEQDFQSLVDGCDQAATRTQLRRRFAGYLYQAFDRYCPKETARQLDAWARNRPNLYKYLNQES